MIFQLELQIMQSQIFRDSAEGYIHSFEQEKERERRLYTKCRKVDRGYITRASSGSQSTIYFAVWLGDRVLRLDHTIGILVKAFMPSTWSQEDIS